MRKQFNSQEVMKAVEIFGTRVALAKAINLSYQTVSDWVNEKKTPTLDNCIKIEKATAGKVKARDILPDYPWDELR